MAADDRKSGVSGKLKTFFQGVKTEFYKIIWPSKQTAGKELLAVLVVSVITGLIIAAVDFGSQELVNLLTSVGK